MQRLDQPKDCEVADIDAPPHQCCTGEEDDGQTARVEEKIKVSQVMPHGYCSGVRIVSGELPVGKSFL